MEQQYIFFRSGKALLLFSIGVVLLLVLAIYLAVTANLNKYIFGIIMFFLACAITWYSFYVDRK